MKTLALALVLVLVLWAPAQADVAKKHVFMPAVGAQVSQFNNGESAGLWTSGYFNIPRMTWWLPDVMGLSFTTNLQSGADMPPSNSLAVEGWWAVLKSPIIDIAPGGGIGIANVALDETEARGLWGVSLFLKINEVPMIMLSAIDYNDWGHWDIDLTGRVAVVTALPF